MTISRALAALLVLTLSPVNVLAEINIAPYIKYLIRQEARRQGADENFVLAVAHIESRIGNKEFRTGLMGRTYYGPFGVHKCFLSRWPINRLDENIRVGVSALRGGFKSLRRYNASYNSAYAGAIKQAMRKYELEFKNLR